MNKYTHTYGKWKDQRNQNKTKVVEYLSLKGEQTK